MKYKQNYLTKLKQWLFAGEDSKETPGESSRRMNNISKKEMPAMEPVRMVHQYPKEGPFRFPLIEDEKKKQKNQHPDRSKPKAVQTNNPRPKVEAAKKNPNQEARKVKSGNKKERPEVYSNGPFKAQEIPSPIYGLKLQRERVKYFTQKNHETIENTPSEEPVEPAITYESFSAGKREYFVEKPVAEEPGEETEAKEEKLITAEENDVTGTAETNSLHRTEEIFPPDHELAQNNSDNEWEKTAESRVQEENLDKAEEKPDKVIMDKSSSSSTDAAALSPLEEAQRQEAVKASSAAQEKLRRKEGPPSQIHSVSRSERKNKMRHKSQAVLKQEPKSIKKEPFNVIMKPSDRSRLEKRKKEEKNEYIHPGLHLLDIPPRIDNEQDAWAKDMSRKLDETMSYFRVQAQVVQYTSGPSVTRFELQPEPGVKINKIVQLTDDLKRSLAATEIRIEAPIPGKTTVGIEVPNPTPTPVVLRSVLRDRNFREAASPLTVALGVDISGEAIVTDIASMPHGLIAGTTGSGKSVCVNSMLTSILYKSSPEEVRLLLIDPKMVELAPFNRVPHLAAPVITDTKEATAALKWAVEEMERRYQLFAEAGARDLQRYNNKAETKLPQLVIVVDELADLMMVAPHEVEEAICRIAQKARACGIHLLVATQRPSVDVITGLIKANIPSRIAFSVSSMADSRTILDSGGAERLLGKGDMLFHPNSSPKPVRIQGTFVTDDEIDRVIDHVANMKKPAALFDPAALKEAAETASSEDDLFQEAYNFVVEKQAASTSLLQRQFQIGYNRAARLIDDMEAQGIVSPAKGSKPRDVYSSSPDI
ncbi:DNA translocase FtsK [Alkalicoccus daliensis]|uniref:DNA segregation ATPase FtsK/SpoIIIE, S-DNA-T family n=1 Tax=Alkalicoccus daliensis TaxID=745820 RepID=A0A1H0H4C3_9BACI|nr:DNA translocase FtsK [Alkalicoccus daliensis]SDO13761.1 DNA segregation ATPase FtsK/SpoIIIE, S-DNA-T family [Alkalicoccus daliensis]